MDPHLVSLFAEALGKNGGAPLEGSELRRRLFEALLQGQFGQQSEQNDSDATAEPHRDETAEAERLRRTVGHLTALVRYIGEIFAACPLCWGTRRDCPKCHGAGSPGTQPLLPERQTDFMAWVQPNLTARGLAIAPASKPAGNSWTADGSVHRE